MSTKKPQRQISLLIDGALRHLDIVGTMPDGAKKDAHAAKATAAKAAFEQHIRDGQTWRK